MLAPLDTDEFTIYGAENCINCSDAKKTLDLYNIKYIYYDIGKKENGDFITFFNSFQSSNLIPNTHKTVPVIFNYGKFIGGYTQLINVLKKRQIDDDSEF
jgi:glutaredoxin